MNASARTVDLRLRRLLWTMPIGIILWVMLWAAIDSGPWYLMDPVGFWEHIHAVCALLPFFAIPVAVIIIVARRARSAFSWSSPLRLMALYGAVGLFSTMFSPRPLQAFYWGSLYLSVFLVIESLIGKPHALESVSQLVVANWLIVGAYAMVLVIIGRNEMFSEGGQLIGYGIFNRMPSIVEMPMSRSSGIGRFAAIPAIIAFSRILNGKGSLRFLWVVPLVIFTAVVITMQSRGAVFGLAAGLCLILVLHRANIRVIFIALLIFVGALLIDNQIPDRTVKYIYRGQDRVEFLTLTGRTNTWEEGWELFKESPLFGFGPQADRYSLHGQHMHNAYLYALTQSGVVGTIPFVAAWLLGWFQFSQIVRRRNDLPEQQRLLLYEAGAVFALFTVRSIPESSAAFFGVDLMVVAPLLAYFHILYSHYRTVRFAKTQKAPDTAREVPWARYSRQPYRWMGKE